MSTQQQTVQSKGNVAYRIGVAFNNFSQKYLPDSLSIAIILAILVFLIGTFATGTSPILVAEYFTGGMWNLLQFSMQVCVMMLCSAILAKTKPVSAVMNRLAGVPKTPSQAYVFGVVMFMIINSIQSTFEIPFAAIYAKTVSKRIKGIHFPYLLALGYVAEIMWQSTVGGTIPLLVSTEGSFAAEAAGGAIPLADIIFSPANIAITLTLLLTIPMLALFMMPRNKNEIVEYDPSRFEDEVFECSRPANPTFAQKVMFFRPVSFVLGVIIVVPALIAIAQQGINALNVNTINMLMFGFCLLAVDHPAELVKRIGTSAAAAGPTIIQFPIYAGIMGIMSGCGLINIVVSFFASIATAQTLPNIVNLSSGLLNFVIPSCGTKFSIEAPIYFNVAQQLGTDLANLTVANAWGDAVLKIMHPFYALPILAIGKIEAKDILGYTTVFALYAFVVIQVIIYVCNALL